MMRQRISSTQTSSTAGDSSSATPVSSNRPLTARKRSSGRQRQSSSSNVIEEEAAFVGLSGKRSWSSEDLTTTTTTSSSAYYHPPKDAQSAPTSPPLSGGFLMQSSTTNNNSNSIFYQQQFSDPQPQLQDFHVTYRNALHVPDNHYEAYVLGYAHRRRTPPLVTKVCCAHTCLGFSTVGFVFLIWVGIMLDTQPLYIKGSLPQQMVADQDTGKPIMSYRLPEQGERLPMASTAYHAAFCYFCCILACIYTLYPQWIQSKIYRFRNRYEDVDQNNHHLPQTTQSHNQSQDEIELGDMGQKMRSPAWFNHIMMNGKHWLAAKGLYKPDTSRRRMPNAKTV